MTATIEFRDDFGKAGRFMGRMADQFPFAISKTINATALDFQRFQRLHQRNVFEVRRAAFVDRSVKIKPFARKTSLEAVVTVDPPGGQARADILTKFEPGGRKTAKDGRSVAVPFEAGRTKKGIIRKGERPRSFAFRKAGRVFKGKRRTFMIPGVGIFRRLGSESVALVYLLVRSVPIPKSLRFIANAKKVVPRVLPGHFSTEFANAVRSAKR